MRSKKQIYGFSLIELMITMLISLVLMLGVMSIMVSTKRSYHVQNDMGRLSENARFALELIANDLRMAGCFGCPDQIPSGVIPLAGRNNDGANSSDVILVSFVDGNRNAFSVVHAAPVALNASPLQAGQNQFTVTTRGELFVGDNVFVSDCVGSTSYTVQAITSTQVTLNGNLDRTYDNNGQSHGAEMRRLVTYRYFTDGSSLFRDNGPIGAALSASNAEELIEGVENMQIRYGEDTDGDGTINQYRDSDTVTNMQNVRAVRVTLLSNTITPRSDRDKDTNTYKLGPDSSDTYDPTDDYLRRAIFTTTAELRNIN